MTDPVDTCKRCVQGLADRIRPDITTTSDVRIIRIDDEDVVEILVHEGPEKPYYLRDKGCRPEGAFIRRGTSTVPTTGDVFYRLVHDIPSSKYEDQTSFRQDLTFRYLESAMEAKGISFDEDKARIPYLKNDDGFTNLGFILSDQFDQPIRMAVFPDEYKSMFIERESVDGSVLEQGDSVHHEEQSHLVDDRREVLHRCPGVSLESGQRSYFECDSPQGLQHGRVTLISIFPDRLTIVSPGSLNTGFSKEDLIRGVSSLRNKHLADILYRMELIEAYGTGIPRIMMEYKDEGTGPAIEPGPSTFTIVLPAKIGSSDPEPDLESFLSSRNEFTRNELQEYLSVSRSGATAMVNDLIVKGRIVRIGDGRTTRYRVPRTGHSPVSDIHSGEDFYRSLI